MTELSAGNIMTVIIAVAIGLIVLSSIVPTAMDQFYNANTTNWKINGQEDVKTTSIWNLLPLFVVLVFLMIFVGLVYVYIR